jgi:hypothetical protein
MTMNSQALRGGIVITGRRPRHRHAAPRRTHARFATRTWGRLAVLVAAVPVGLLVCGALVWNSSSAAFIAVTDNPANVWQAGAVSLTNDRASAALFTTATEGLIVPGSSGFKCITVTYTGNVSTAEAGVRLYGTLTADTDAALAAALQVTVQMSTTALGTTAADCSPSFPATTLSYTGKTFGTFPTSFTGGLGDLNTDGLGDWRPNATTDRSRTYKISYSLPTGPSTTTMAGKKVGMSFTWEVQSDDTPGT